MRDAVRTNRNLPTESSRPARRENRREVGATHAPSDQPDETDTHARLRDRGPPGRAFDPPVEAVDEEHLEHHVERVPEHDQHKRRAKLRDASQISLPAEGEEERRHADRHDPQVGRRVLGRLPLDADDRRRSGWRAARSRRRARLRWPARARAPARRASARSRPGPLRSHGRPGPSSRTGGS